jgi:hypothetical protein
MERTKTNCPKLTRTQRRVWDRESKTEKKCWRGLKICETAQPFSLSLVIANKSDFSIRKVKSIEELSLFLFLKK